MKQSAIIELLERGETPKYVSNLLVEEGKILKDVDISLNLDAYIKRVQRLYVTYKNFCKSKARPAVKEQLDSFLGEDFKFPSARQYKSTKPSTQEVARLNPSKDTLVTVVSDIAEELRHEKRKSVTAKKHLEEEIKEKASKIDKLETISSVTKARDIKKREELKRARAREGYLRQKVQKLEAEQQPVVPEPETKSEKLLKATKKENEELRKKVAILEYKLETKEEDLAFERREVVEIYDDEKKSYKPELQMCVHSLLENHVSTARVAPVIEACLKLGGKTANKLPSATTVNNMNVQRLVLAQKQLAEEVSTKEHLTIETDETSKYGTKYGVFAVRDDEGRGYVLGLREMTTKSGQDTLQTLKEILWDLDDKYYSGENKASEDLLFHIRNTMSDRAATELKFNELLEEYRRDVLPKVVRDWEELTDEEKEIMGRLNNFFCGLHSLVHFAEVTDKALKEVETSHFNGKTPAFSTTFSKKSESGVTRLIRTACKSFAFGGDEKTGCHGQFLTYINQRLKDNHMHSFPLTPFRGSRFNILFHNAAVVYFFHNNMSDFLKNYGSCQWVLHDLEVPFFVAGCKALGLVCKLITTPLWHLIERKDITILQMNGFYLQLTTYLEQSALDVDLFMSGQSLPFGEDTHVKRDPIFEELIKESEFDGDAASILSVVLPALAKLSRKLFKEHLPGGKFENPSEDIVAATSGTAKHNKFSETLFAYFDGLMRYKPHIKTLSAEAYVVFAHNRTRQWLESKDDNEIKVELDEAYKKVAKTRKLFKARQVIIQERKQQLLHERLQRAEAAKQKKLAEAVTQTNEMIYWGLWQNTMQVDTVLNTIRGEKEKREALKAQLRFRKNILQQATKDKTVFNFTKADGRGKRVDVTLHEMTENVKQLVREAYSVQSDVGGAKTGIEIVGKQVKHKFSENGQEVWYEGQVISQVFVVDVRLVLVEVSVGDCMKFIAVHRFLGTIKLYHQEFGVSC